jgi:dolichol-phosphate mannosyltransferase|tara:strand:+ start:517 stop:1242 length:726 start_codon:yes stop_codon:yes gene_type:complete
MKSLCIIPCWNEEDRLSSLINQINNFDNSKYKVDFLFINNGSTDESLKIIKNSKIEVKSYKKNRGAGYALIDGLKIGIKKKYDVIVHLAANGKMLPNEIIKFLDKISIENYAFVHGSRFLKGGNYKSNPLQRVFLIKTFTFLLNIISKKKITDATCGFRAYKISVLSQNIDLVDKEEFYTYGYEYYVLGKILKSKNISYTEIPVSMNYPKTGNYSKIRTIIDWYPIIRAYFLSFFDRHSFK